MMKWKAPKRKNSDADCESAEEIKIIAPMGKDSSGEPQGNRVYFYTDVTKDSVLNLIRQIDELSKQMKMVQYSYRMPSPPPIEIHIASDGGEIFPALSAVDRISGSDVPIHTYCEGVVASAATLISVVGKKRFMTKNSCMLIHQVSGGLWGSYMEFKDEIQNLDLIMKIIRDIYLKNTHFDDNALENILKHDLYLSAEDCLKHGLIDEIS